MEQKECRPEKFLQFVVEVCNKNFLRSVQFFQNCMSQIFSVLSRVYYIFDSDACFSPKMCDLLKFPNFTHSNSMKILRVKPANN